MFAGKPSRLFCRFALMQMLGLLFNSVYFLVDGMFIGHRLGRAALAAAGVGVPVIEFLLALSLGLTAGGSALAAAALGRREEGQARAAFTSAVAGTLALSGLIAVAGNLCLPALVRALGATEALRSEAAAYLRWILGLSPFLMLSYMLGGFVRCDGRPALATAALAVGSMLNVLLDWLFMYPLGLGISGAALATGLGPVVSVLLLLPHFLGRRGRLYPEAAGLRPRLFGRAVRLGLPAFVMECSIGLVTFIYNLAIRANGYGELGLAAYLLIGYLLLIYFTVFLGCGEGLQPVFAYDDGAGRTGEGKALLRFSLAALLGIGAVLFALIAVGSGRFYALFAPDDPELVAFAAARSPAYFSLLALAGGNILLIYYGQAVRRTGAALTAALLRSALLPTLAASLFPALFGREALWTCHAVAELGTALVAAALFRNALRGSRS